MSERLTPKEAKALRKRLQGRVKLSKKELGEIADAETPEWRADYHAALRDLDARYPTEDGPTYMCECGHPARSHHFVEPEPCMRAECSCTSYRELRVYGTMPLPEWGE